MNAGFQEKGCPTLKIGIGLNTAEMTVATWAQSSAWPIPYWVMRSTWERAWKAYANIIQSLLLFVSEFAVRAATQYPYRELDLIRVKDKDAPVRIYALIVDEDHESAQELAQYKLALAAYR